MCWGLVASLARFFSFFFVQSTFYGHMKIFKFKKCQIFMSSTCDRKNICVAMN